MIVLSLSCVELFGLFLVNVLTYVMHNYIIMKHQYDIKCIVNASSVCIECYLIGV